MSVRTATFPSWPVTRPMAMPPTGALMGTPASIRASVDPHTEAMEVEPLDSRTSDTSRMVYGKAVSSGIIGRSARSTSNPWPTSRRPGPRSGRTSPTENGGKE